MNLAEIIAFYGFQANDFLTTTLGLRDGHPQISRRRGGIDGDPGNV